MTNDTTTIENVAAELAAQTDATKVSGFASGVANGSAAKPTASKERMMFEVTGPFHADCLAYASKLVEDLPEDEDCLVILEALKGAKELKAGYKGFSLDGSARNAFLDYLAAIKNKFSRQANWFVKNVERAEIVAAATTAPEQVAEPIPSDEPTESVS